MVTLPIACGIDGTVQRWDKSYADLVVNGESLSLQPILSAGIPRIPASPASVTAVGGANQATVSFTPQGLAAVGYVVRASSASAPNAVNLFPRSQDFANASWTKFASSIDAATFTAPDGTATAVKLLDSTANSTHSVDQAIAVVSGNIYTITCFIKAAGRTSAALRMNSGGYGAVVTASFNLQAVTATVITPGTNTTASITSVGNGWYRCRLSSQATASVSTSHFIMIENPAGTRTFVGNGVDGLLIWGAQLQVGSATSYQRQDASGTRFHQVEFGSSSPIVVNGLAAATSYTFTVQAYNANGYSAQSASSNSVTTA